MPEPGESVSRPPDRWSELGALLDALLEVPPEQRAERIDQLSGGDPARRAELAALLAESEQDPPLLAVPAADRFAELLADDPERFPEALAGRYRVDGVLGRGGAATVYRAGDLKHGREVAVKVLHPAVAAAVGTDRFLREIEIVARLRHPLIVPLYDSGEADGRLYYIMPYEAGGTLRDRLAACGALSVDEAVRILRDVCDALAYAHERGVVHRDVKPGNVLLAGDHALVADFGVARADETPRHDNAATGHGVVLGTPAYMAPEQIAADTNVDHRADIYAVGVVAYEMLAGRPPFLGATRQELLSAHLVEPPAPITMHRPDIPRELADAVMRCLEKRAADRWQSVGDLARRLGASAPPGKRSRRGPGPLATGVGVAVVLATVALLASMSLARRASDEAARGAGWPARWAAARIERLTDFAGDEVDAAISPDGQFVAFLADRDSVFDAFVTQVGSGEFVNLTRGRVPQLLNEDVRNIGFSGDGARVWVRVGDISSPARVATVSTLGGPLHPFLGGAVMAAWSPDGTRLAYHEATPGDPVYVADADGGNARRVFISDPGVHSHYLSWSPDGRYLFAARGLPPDEMDVWRVPATGGTPERLTSHRSRVAYPVQVDDNTVLYTATADDGTGPWLYAMDLTERVPRRVSAGVEQYLSIAASVTAPDRRKRLVATVSNPVVQLWSVAITPGIADEQNATRLTLPTARAGAPRFESDSVVLYLASRGGPDGLWRVTGGAAGVPVAIEVWKPVQGAVADAAAVSPDGRRVCVPVRRDGRSTLHCSAADGSGMTPLGPSLDVRGAPSWSPDGRWLAVAARESADPREGTRLFKVPVSGGPPVRLLDSLATRPVWSPDGRFIVYSGTPRGRLVPLAGVTPGGGPYALPSLLVDRVGDGYRFASANSLVVKLGGFRRQDFWSFDLTTGERRQLTRLRPGESVRRFDVSPDSRRIVFERVRENSDVVLIEPPAARERR